MNDEIKFDLLLDAKGLGCPLPILKVSFLAPGAVFVVALPFSIIYQHVQLLLK